MYMIGKTIRKILQSGHSGSVVIPKDYRDEHKLGIGESVTVLYDDLVLIIPPDRKHVIKEKESLILELLRK